MICIIRVDPLKPLSGKVIRGGCLYSGAHLLFKEYDICSMVRKRKILDFTALFC